jgi:phosphotransferase system  glucose/maltose/N-acetylglucosamine-specific IIC component
MFVPIFYNAISFSFKHLLTTLLFFPVFYYLIELIDVETPDSEALKEDKKES